MILRSDMFSQWFDSRFLPVTDHHYLFVLRRLRLSFLSSGNVPAEAQTSSRTELFRFPRRNCLGTEFLAQDSNSVRGIRLCQMMDKRVPALNSGWSGTGTVMVPVSDRRCITTWLPRRRTSSVKPFFSRIWQTCRPERTRSLAMRSFESCNEYFVV